MRYAKFWTAAGGALALAGVLAPGGFTLAEGIAVALAGLTAAGVYTVPNTPAPDPEGDILRR